MCKSNEIIKNNLCQKSSYIDFNYINSFETSFQLNQTIYDLTLEIWIFFPYSDLFNILLDINSQISIRYSKVFMDTAFSVQCNLNKMHVSLNFTVFFGVWKNIKCGVKSNENFFYLSNSENSLIFKSLEPFHLSSNHNLVNMRFSQYKNQLNNPFYMRNLRIWNIYLYDYIDTSKMYFNFK